MVALDTSRKAAEFHAAIHRRLGPGERFRMAIEVSDFARELMSAGLRTRFPDASETQLRHEMIQLLYGIPSPRK